MTRFVRRFGFALYVAIVAEIVFQAFYWIRAGQPLWRRTALPIFAADATTGFWNKRNLDYWQRTGEYQSHIVTNADGLRVAAPGVEYRKGRDASRYRVLLLGPSFAFGWGVGFEHSFGQRLETVLNERGFVPGKRVEVINAGVPFMSAHQSLDWYRRNGAAYAPDLVILFVYGSLDIAGEYGSERLTVDRDGYLVPRDGAPGGLRVIAKNSALAFYGWRIYTELQARRAPPEAAKPIEGAGRVLSAHSAFGADGPEVAESVATYRRARDLSAAGGARLIILFFPAAYVVHREDVSRWQHVGVADIDTQIDYDRRFCGYLTAQGLDCLDITPNLVSAARSGTRMYYWLDGHWTPEGNATAASAVAGRLLTSPNTW